MLAFWKLRALPGSVNKMIWSCTQKSLQVAVTNFGTRDAQTDRKMETERTILLYCTNCHHIKANVKYFLRLREQTFQFIRTGFSHRNRLTFPGGGWGAGTMRSDAQYSDIWGRRKSEICICHRLHPRVWVCVSLGGFSFWKDWSSFLPFWVSEYL